MLYLYNYILYKCWTYFIKKIIQINNFLSKLKHIQIDYLKKLLVNLNINILLILNKRRNYENEQINMFIAYI